VIIFYDRFIEYFLKEWNNIKEVPMILSIVIIFGIMVGIGIGYVVSKWRYCKLIEILKEKQSNLDLQTKAITKINLSEYELDQSTGWFSHKERGGKLCPKCLSKEREVLLVVDKAGWDCPVCGEARITMKGPECFGTIYNP